MPRKVGTFDLIRFVRVRAVLLTWVHAHPLLQLSAIDRSLAGIRRHFAWLGANDACRGG
jgi:proteasome lid subunit RPN8/RPN11